jgi:hypothetical protein
VVSDIEWRKPRDDVQTGDIVGRVSVDIGEARALVIGPDDRLVIVMPGYVNSDPQIVYAHAARIREAIGNRFVILAGDDIQLAKVKDDDWGRPALGDIPTDKR